MTIHRKTLAAAIVGSLMAGPAGATVVYNASLGSPNADPATNAANSSSNNASWFNGSGNPQGGFTVATDNGIELGLRAKQRGTDTIYWNSSNLYYVPLGTVGSPQRAIWNYEFSIDVRPGGGSGTSTLADYLVSLTVTDSHGHTNTVNPVTYWHDNSYYGSAAGSDGLPGTPPSTGAGKHVGDVAAGDWDAQNSENPIFGDFPLAAFFDPNQQGTYTFTLEVRDQGQNLLASDTMIVSTPEPATLSMLGFGALGLLAARRRKA